jgi:hypothetical protein
MRTRLSQVLFPVLGAALLVLALIGLSKAAREQLRQHERYTVAFADIDCDAPPGMERAAFLAEVQYLGQFPDRLPSLDEDGPARLAAAFARHPWVEKVEGVRVLPPDRVRVRLTFRVPALAVPQPGGLRAVDARGILLPPGAPTEGLPVFRGRAAPPAGLAGEPWGDPAVAAAAAKASHEHAGP